MEPTAKTFGSFSGDRRGYGSGEEMRSLIGLQTADANPGGDQMIPHATSSTHLYRPLIRPCLGVFEFYDMTVYLWVARGDPVVRVSDRGSLPSGRAEQGKLPRWEAPFSCGPTCAPPSERERHSGEEGVCIFKWAPPGVGCAEYTLPIVFPYLALLVEAVTPSLCAKPSRPTTAFSTV